MSVKFVGITEEDFLIQYKTLYRFTTIDRFIESLESLEFTFISPSLWPDPYERYYLERKFIITGNPICLPAKNKVFAVCLSKTISSEAYWKVYAPKEDGIRLSFDTNKLLNCFLKKLRSSDVYIGKVDYQRTINIIKDSFDKESLIHEIKRIIVGEEQIKLLLKKRISFLYEDEIRIIIVPHGRKNGKKIHKEKTDIKEFTKAYLIDPRLGKNHAKLLKNYFLKKFELKVSQSQLYSNINIEPFNLIDEVQINRTRRPKSETQ